MKVCKLKSNYGYIGTDDVKSALSFIQRVINNNITYKKLQNKIGNKNSISDDVCDRLKDICNWLNRPCGEKYYDDARKAYLIYNCIDI